MTKEIKKARKAQRTLEELQREEVSYIGRGKYSSGGKPNPSYPVLWNEGVKTKKRRRRR